MKTIKIILSGIAGAIIIYLLGWFIYGMLLSDFTQANYNQCAGLPMCQWHFWAMFIADLAYGFLLAIVLNWSKTKGILAGLKVGALIGLLIAVSMDFNMYSMSSDFLNFKAVCVDVVVYTIMSAIAGLVVGLIMSIGKKST